MARFNPAAFLPRLLAAVNDPSNDYVYRKALRPGGPQLLLGQQFRLTEVEATNLMKRIDSEAWWTNPSRPNAPPQDVRAEVVKLVHHLQEPATALLQNTGSISLERDAADVLTSYARSLGVSLLFDFDQPKPNHPRP